MFDVFVALALIGVVIILGAKVGELSDEVERLSAEPSVIVTYSNNCQLVNYPKEKFIRCPVEMNTEFSK